MVIDWVRVFFSYNGHSCAFCLTDGVAGYMGLTCTYFYLKIFFYFQQGFLSNVKYKIITNTLILRERVALI